MLDKKWNLTIFSRMHRQICSKAIGDDLAKTPARRRILRNVMAWEDGKILLERKMKKLFMLIIIAGLLFPSISFTQMNKELIEGYSPKLEIEYVIKKGKDHAAKQGMKLEDYFIETIKYNSSGKEWKLFFIGKLPTPGNHFIVVIKDRTEEITFMPGE
jgi:hypothetical protein